MDTKHVGASLAGGLAGAAATTVVHQAMKPVVRGAPRMDVLGRRAIAYTSRGAGVEPPKGQSLQRAALVTDIVSNTLYYAMVGLSRRKGVMGTGAALGTLAGLGGVLLPPVVGLGRKPSGRSGRTMALTVLYYLIGGLVSAAVYKALMPDQPSSRLGRALSWLGKK